MNWFKWILIALQISSAIPQIIITTEQAVGAGNGPTKKAIALTGVATAATIAGASADQAGQLLSAASTAIDANVAALNAAGILKNKE